MRLSFWVDRVGWDGDGHAVSAIGDRERDALHRDGGRVPALALRLLDG